MINTNLPIERILLIDDDEDDCLVFKMALTEINPSIKIFYESCGDTIESTLATTEPDIVFLDINLPRVTGLECLEQIKKSAVYRTMPVIMYSSSELPKDLAAAYDIGATLYFRKPSDITSLINSLRKILEMNWRDPATIRSQYCHKGIFQTV